MIRDNEKFKAQAKELVSKMTVEEKASQLTYNSPAIKRLGVPAYNWWNEALHGVARAGTATSFPQAIGLAAAFSDEMIFNIAKVISDEGRAKYNEASKHEDRDIYKGLTFWSPNVNIFRDPRWGRGHETYGEDPILSSKLGVAFINGLQGDKEIMEASACAKHFAVHSGPEELRHEFDAVVNEKDLRETYLPAFKACVEDAEVESVMGAYNRTNGEPCNGSYMLLRDILRGEWKFDGHVVSDCWAIKDFHMHHMVTGTAEESVALAMDAGCDLNCGNMYLYVYKAYKDGLISEDMITRACERIFTTRFKLGMFSETEFDNIPYEVVESKEHIDLAIDAARKGIVLLKNDGILPLDKTKLKTIGVIGPNANSRLALKGNYYGTSSHYVTILEGIQKEVGEDVRVLYSNGCELTKDRTEPLAMENDRLMEAVTVAEHSDVVIMCIGLDETLEGEEGDEGNQYASGDKNDLEFPFVQRQLLDEITKVGKPVIVCSVAGSSMNLSYSEEHNNGILQVWYPGASGGIAVSDLLFGKVSPSGKLPVTFYKGVEDLPDFVDYNMKNRTYRYYEGTPLYPFGYGLNYGDINVKSAEIKDGSNKDINLSIQVENSGDFDTEDVVQVYLKNTKSQFEVLNTRLVKFKRINLKSKEKVSLNINIPYDKLMVYNDEGKQVIDGNSYEIYVGTSAPDNRSVELTGKTPIKINYELA
ncbi:MAG: glycoside hydrolase family 3 C-terminal domain-containing protein [Lachnospiraceae bacterium]|jgi:beta-glucosidase|nr:glycoside hydrolase family 3 C-terminal domain-containing protein [Lachnospiraceae bacterium]